MSLQDGKECKFISETRKELRTNPKGYATDGGRPKDDTKRYEGNNIESMFYPLAKGTLSIHSKCRSALAKYKNMNLELTFAGAAKVALNRGEEIFFEPVDNSLIEFICVTNGKLTIECRQSGKTLEDFQYFAYTIIYLVKYLRAAGISPTIRTKFCYHCVTIVGEEQMKKTWQILRGNNSFAGDAEDVAKIVDEFYDNCTYYRNYTNHSNRSDRNENRLDGIISKL